MRFRGRSVWITGASSGIGEALALAFAREGARVLLSARRTAELERVRGLCPAGSAETLALDLADHSSLAAVAQRAWAEFGPVDIMVHNGGISQRSLAKVTAPDVDARLIAVNYLGPVFLTKALLPRMLERGQGHFVVISSLVGKLGSPLRSGYAGSKHALHGFFDSLRAECQGAGIHVTMICPGFVRTDISRNALTGDGSAQGTMDRATGRGISAGACAGRILDAVAARRVEVYVGGREKLGVYVMRFSPAFFAWLLRRVKVT